MFGRKKKDNTERLEMWKSRFQQSKTAYGSERAEMTRREDIYRGSKDIKPADGAGQAKKAAHVRNVAAEMVEAQVSSTIPQPKVTALREQDEPLARIIEDMIRNELDRLPMEYNNDMEERTVTIQGGSLSLVEWDSGKKTHETRGALSVTYLHPLSFTPQNGVTSDIEDMDYWFLEMPRTKGYIKRRYGVDINDEAEEAPEVRGGEETCPAEDMVTQVIAYYRNEEGGVGLFSWVGETVLEDMEDYQARKVYRCEKCDQPGDGHRCRFCGSERFREGTESYETLEEDVVKSSGEVIPAWSPVVDEWGEPVMEPALDAAGNAVMLAETDENGAMLPDGMGGYRMKPALQQMREKTRIPFYKPNIYPLILRKNVSVYGRVLGDSDVDKIRDQQESIKKVETKLIEKLFKGGSILTAPTDAQLDLTDEDLRVLRLRDAAQKAMIGVLNLQPDISGDLAFLNQSYEEARQIVGITDSFQGRQDRTATSGVAKEFSARQAAGRLESKRTMKDAYYSRLFEAMFQFALAYADEPRRVVAKDNQGHTKYEVFNRYDFLEQDEAGEFYWNDRFLFSVDASASLEKNREALWQECRLNFQQGCFGDPKQLETLMMFWTRMEKLHYPGAGDIKTYFEEKLSQQQEQQQIQMGAAAGGGNQVGGAQIEGARMEGVQAMNFGGGMV